MTIDPVGPRRLPIPTWSLAIEFFHGLFFVLFGAWTLVFDALNTGPTLILMRVIAPPYAWAIVFLAIGGLRWLGLFQRRLFVRLVASYASIFLWSLMLIFSAAANPRSFGIPTWLVLLLAAIYLHARMAESGKQHEPDS